ncbi:unnamed protein product [Rotaria socialis]|uniref:Uncharacterized protein n=1 Tax=Rotaria socialis TaxID=392032 RepID=A0A818D0Y3_9BILA|nr:unnamed protein product [Rotaria socialis]CAF3418400.1 unnamed protein product [Rotaria socialis]CAF3437257.1 unnamed protein product [Rotaria socialis]CAF3640860.1 unnamed protein product [Rotaria socialis]CAF4286931.1 unnamed protein product [Rotaria socialis]
MILSMLECLHRNNGVTYGEAASKPLHVQLKRFSEFASSATTVLKALYKARSSMETVEPTTSQSSLLDSRAQDSLFGDSIPIQPSLQLNSQSSISTISKPISNATNSIPPTIDLPKPI